MIKETESLGVMRSLQMIDQKVSAVGNGILALRDRLSPLLAGENEPQPGRMPLVEKMSIKPSEANLRADEIEDKLDDMLDLLGSISARL